MDYKAGGYIQIEIPKCEVKYSDIDISAHLTNILMKKINLSLSGTISTLAISNEKSETVERAYSMASFPAEGKELC